MGSREAQNRPDIRNEEREDDFSRGHDIPGHEDAAVLMSEPKGDAEINGSCNYVQTDLDVQRKSLLPVLSDVPEDAAILDREAKSGYTENQSCSVSIYIRRGAGALTHCPHSSDVLIVWSELGGNDSETDHNSKLYPPSRTFCCRIRCFYVAKPGRSYRRCCPSRNEHHKGRLTAMSPIACFILVSQYHPSMMIDARKISNVCSEPIPAIDTLGLREDGVIGREEEIVEQLQQAGILMLRPVSTAQRVQTSAAAQRTLLNWGQS